MKQRNQTYPWLAALLLVALLVTSTTVAASPQAGQALKGAAAPELSAQPAVLMPALPDATCDLVGDTRTCHLYAKTGSISLPGEAGDISVPVWGFAANETDAPTLPGPALIAHVGETLVVVLHNGISDESIALDFPGQTGLAPDLEGVAFDASPNTKTYTFDLVQPGTFFYKAGPTMNGARQVAMGLFGAMIVRPSTANQAYGDGSLYDEEALLILSEVDPNTNVNAAAQAWSEYIPRYWLINGQPHPTAESVGTQAGHTVLLRYINLGSAIHSIGVLGMSQKLIARDGEALEHPTSLVAESLAPSQTLDTLLTIPANAQTGSHFVLYHSNMIMHNDSLAVSDTDHRPALGGMLTTLNVTSGSDPGTAGPQVSGVYLSSTNTAGDQPVTLSAAFATPVTAAEYFTNGFSEGTGTAMVLSSATTASVTFSSAEMGAWNSGTYTFYVRGQDANGWGPISSVTLNLDKLGPALTGMYFNPAASSGTVDVELRATGDDHETGGNDVVQAEYSLDGANWIVMTRIKPDGDASIVSFETLIPAASFTGAVEGLLDVQVRATDSLGNVTGVPGTAAHIIDVTGPQVDQVVINPTSLSFPVSIPSVRLTAVASDLASNGVQTNLVRAEGFIVQEGSTDPFPNPGKGFALFAKDGVYDETSEEVYLDMPVSWLAFLGAGEHTVYVRALDKAGNWTSNAAAAGVTFTVSAPPGDATGPVVSNMQVSPSPTDGAVTVTLQADVSDPNSESNIVKAEWFTGTDLGPGNNIPMEAVDGFDGPAEALTAAINVSGWRNGDYLLYIRAQDAAGNWSSRESVLLRVSGNSLTHIAANSFEQGFAGWDGQVGAVQLMPEAALHENMGMAAAMNGEPAFTFMNFTGGEPIVWTSFVFDPNSITSPEAHNVLVGMDGEEAIFGISIKGVAATMASGQTSGYQVTGWVNANGMLVESDPFTITNDVHRLGLNWNAGANTSFTVLVDGNVVDIVHSINTHSFQLTEIVLGPSNANSTMSGTGYYDNLVISRPAVIHLPMIGKP